MRKYLAIYYSHKDKFNQLTDEEAGKLIKAALTYGDTGEIPSFGEDRILNFAWADMMEEIDIANETYERKIQGAVKGGKNKALKNNLNLSEQNLELIKKKTKCNDVYAYIESIQKELDERGLNLVGNDFVNYALGDKERYIEKRKMSNI